MAKNQLLYFLCLISLSCSTTKTNPIPKLVTPKAEQKLVRDEATKIDKKEAFSAKKNSASKSVYPFTAKGPVAKVDGYEISAEAFNNEVKELTLHSSPLLVALVTKEQIIEVLIERRIHEAAIATTLPTINEQEFDEEFENVLAWSKGQVHRQNRKSYKRKTTTESELRSETRRDFALKIFLSQDYDIKVSDDEIQNFYDRNRTRFYRPAEVRASHILFKARTKDKKLLAEAKKKAKTLYRLAIKSGADFSALAKEHSEGPSASRGGDLGFFAYDRMVARFSKAAFATPVGGITKPFKTSFGYHVVKVFDKRAEKRTTLFEATSLIRFQLEYPKRKAAAEAFTAQERQSQKIDVFLDNVIDNPKFDAKP